MVTLKEIYDSVLETYPGNVTEFNATSIIDHINEAYVSIRDEYIKSGKFESFTISKELPRFIDYRNIPYLKYTSIKPAILQQFDFDKVVLYAICKEYPEIDDFSSWVKGDKAVNGTDLYEAVNRVVFSNSSNLKFENCDVRNFHFANGLKYKIGDVINVDDRYFKCIQPHINDYLETPSWNDSKWEEVFWRRIGIGFVDPEVIDFDQLDRKKVAIDSGSSVVSFNDKYVFVSKNIKSATLVYVPVHKWKRNNNDEFEIPDSAIPYWKRSVHQKMGMSQGIMQSQDDE